MTELHVGHGRHEANQVLGALLAEARTRLRLTQVEVAKAAGISRQMMCGLEKGREAPSVDSLTHILTALGEEYQITDNQVIWKNHAIVCPRFTRHRLTGPPDRQVVPLADVRTEGGFIQILDWR